MLGDTINIDENYIEIENSSLLANTKTTLVLALLGRASLPEKLKETHISLEYNKALDVLSVKDSTCTTDKTIYSTIIIASIALLLFFIATNIVNNDQQNHEDHNKKFDPVIKSAFKSQVNLRNTENMQFLRMKF